MKRSGNSLNRLEEYHLHRYPMWWSHPGTSDALEVLLMTAPTVYAKKIHIGDTKQSLYYINMPCTFDIEDSSFYDDGVKVSTMYVWQADFNGVVIMGRTWAEFLEMCKVIQKHTDYTKRMILFVHFLDHEFQFIRKLFMWDNIFSRKERSPIYAVTRGIEFRDSYILTGKSLARVGDDIRTFKGMAKKCGDLDYRKIRGTKTPLIRKEIGYCMGDVQVLCVRIHELIEDEGGNIARLPLTNTGYVRRYTRKMCLPTDKAHADDRFNYYHGIHALNLQPDEYVLLKRAFQGGFTHANALYVGDDITGKIDSIDFTSSYPAVCLSNPFPASAGRKVVIKSQDDLDKYLKYYLCVFTVKFVNIRQKPDVYENIISESKCIIKGKSVVNNGRIVSADAITTTITNIDIECIRKFYDYDNLYLGTFYVYEKGYLPKPIIETILDLYKAKTELKGVVGAEVEYLLKKGMLNSVY